MRLSDDQKEGDKQQADGKQNDKSITEPSLFNKVKEALNRDVEQDEVLAQRSRQESEERSQR